MSSNAAILKLPKLSENHPASLIPSPWQEWQSEPSAMTLRQHSQMECNTCDDRAEESTPQDTLFGNHRLWSRFEHCGILMYS